MNEVHTIRIGDRELLTEALDLGRPFTLTKDKDEEYIKKADLVKLRKLALKMYKQIKFLETKLQEVEAALQESENDFSRLVEANEGYLKNG